LSFLAPKINRDEAGFRPLDIALISYILFELAIVLLFMTGRPGWIFFFGFYIAAGCLAFMVSMNPMRGSWRLLRLIYPIIIMILLYEALNFQIYLIQHHSFDNQIYTMETAIFGFDISFAAQRYMEIWLNEVMNFLYIFYYLFIPVAIFILAKRRLWNSLEKMILSACLTFFACYIIFLFYPVVGPRYYLASIYYLPMIGPIFTPLAQKIVNSGGLHGGAMPSSHCAVALVAVWFLFRELKYTRVFLLSLYIMLCVSTIYGRYHYVSDVFAGIIIGFLGIALGSLWQTRFLKRQSADLVSVDTAPDKAVQVEVED
jgi:membrane-associated phospholipid phosphatase